MSVTYTPILQNKRILIVFKFGIKFVVLLLINLHLLIIAPTKPKIREDT